MGVAGKDAPLPPLDDPSIAIVGARQIDVLDRRTAVVRLTVSGEPVTYLVQHARGIAPKRTERTNGTVRAIAWRKGAFAMAVTGPNGSERWLDLFGKP